MERSVSVFAPATVANVVCAFDALGFALESPGDTVTARRVETPGVSIAAISGDGGKLPYESDKNTASVAAQSLLTHLGSPCGVALEIKKQIPSGSGLGSSAASAAAAAYAVNELLGAPLKKHELVAHAMVGEQVASGSAHADNVAPALLGGFVFVRSTAPLDLIELRPGAAIYYGVVQPHFELNTREARAILKPQVSLGDAVAQWANVGALIAGLLRGDLELFGRSLEDRIIEPQRAALIPGFYEARKAALDHGALGAGISGAGPSLAILCSSHETAHRAADAATRAFTKLKIASTPYSGMVSPSGARVLAREG